MAVPGLPDSTRVIASMKIDVNEDIVYGIQYLTLTLTLTLEVLAGCHKSYIR